MARPKAKQPSYYASRGAYYCWWDGKQHLCAVGPEGQKETVEAAYRKWWALQAATPGRGASEDMTAVSCLDCYCGSVQKRCGERAYAKAKWYAQSFIDYLGRHVAGTLRVRDLTPAIATDWCAKMSTERPHGRCPARKVAWGASSVRRALGVLSAATAHALRMGWTTSNPLARMTRPRITARGPDCVITPAEHGAICAALRPADPLRELLVALHDTGCRPGEVSGLTADQVRETDGVLYLDLSQWKTDGTSAYRHIFLTERLEGIIRRLASAHPTGPLFRNGRGAAWTEYAIARRFQAFQARGIVRATVTAYSYRHAFATDWLVSGKSIKLLADLLGNSVATIERHYAHLLRDKSAMQEALRSFRA